MVDNAYEIPASQKETKIWINLDEETSLGFHVIFFESEITNLKTVTVISKSYNSSRDTIATRIGDEGTDSNTYNFDFEEDGLKVNILIHDGPNYRYINLTY